MSESTLTRVLRLGDDLVHQHKVELRAMAKKFLGTVPTDAKETLVALAEEASETDVVTHLDETSLQACPEGRVTFHLKSNKGACTLGSIIVDITSQRMTAEMEVLVPGSWYERIPIEEVNMEWLVIALKRASSQQPIEPTDR